MTKFGYFVAKNNGSTGFVTVAMTRPPKEDQEQNHKVSFSFCTPSKKWAFQKKIGRTVAEGRLKSGQIIDVSVRGTIPDVMKAALNKAIDEKSVPSWVIKAAKNKTLVYGLSEKVQDIK